MLFSLSRPERILGEFSDACKAIAKEIGVNQGQIAKQEIGIILKAAVGRTKVATPRAIDVGARLKANYLSGLSKSRYENENTRISITAGTSRVKSGFPGLVWLTRRRKDGSRFFVPAGSIGQSGSFSASGLLSTKSILYKDANDAAQDYGAAIPKAKALLEGAQGLSAQSWIQIADALGVPPEKIPGGRTGADKIAKTRRAIATTGKHYANGDASYAENSNGFRIVIGNNYPALQKLKFEQMILTLFQQRIKYFNKNFTANINTNMKRLNQKYPYLKYFSDVKEPDNTNDI
jgi:hypothetical protein